MAACVWHPDEHGVVAEGPPGSALGFVNEQRCEDVYVWAWHVCCLDESHL